MIKYTFLLILIISCSFKKESDSPPPSSKSEAKPIVVTSEELFLDSDGDSITDAEEVKQGSDPFLADIPVFEGTLFEEMKVSIELHNKVSGLYDTLKWEIKGGRIKLSWIKDDEPAPREGLYMETLLKNYAFNNGFKKNDFRFFNFNEGVFSFASPVLFENTLFSISDKLVGLQKQGFAISRAEVLILSQFKLSSGHYQFFRNPVFDVYYKSRNKEGLIFIESKRIDGTYNFNEENQVYVGFESFDENIINDALISGGASFFLKLRDFTIYDNDVTYSTLLQNVLLKSVPVTIAYSNDEETKESRAQTLYVGINGEKALLKDILKKTFKEKVLMTSTSIDQINGLSNKIRSFGETGQNETLKWYVGANSISDNIYSYEFGPNEGIGLAYVSDKKIEKKPIYVSRLSLNSAQNISTSGSLPVETKNLKIRLVPRKLQIPVGNFQTFTQPNCGRGDWDENVVTYQKTVLSWSNGMGSFMQNFVQDAKISITASSGPLIEGSLSALVKDGFISVSNGQSFFDLILSPKLTSVLQKEKQQITVNFALTPKRVPVNVGATREIGRRCRQMRREHHCPQCSNQPDTSMKDSFLYEPAGIMAQEFQYDYDLDIHVFSY